MCLDQRLAQLVLCFDGVEFIVLSSVLIEAAGMTACCIYEEKNVLSEWFLGSSTIVTID